MAVLSLFKPSLTIWSARALVLPARYRSVIHARYWDGLNMEEIGQRFGFTKARADQIVKLGLKRLRTAMEESCQHAS